MTEDLTPYFVKALRRVERWSPEMFPRLLDTTVFLLKEEESDVPLHISIDWNPDTGERWGRILIDQYPIVIGRVELPLVVMLEAYAGVLKGRLSRSGVVGISVENFDSRDYRLRIASIQKVYSGFYWREDGISPDSISIVDLWWHTLQGDEPFDRNNAQF